MRNNTKYAVIDLGFVDQKYKGLGASWLLHELERRNCNISRPEHADVILYSASYATQAERMEIVSRQHDLSNDQIKIVGGGCSYQPAVFIDHGADMVCVGEGGKFMQKLITKGVDAAKSLKQTYTGEERQVIPDSECPTSIMPIMHTDGKLRVIESRGCQGSCSFCQTGWERKHSLNPNIKEQIETCKTIKCHTGIKYDIITNDMTDINLFDGLQIVSLRASTIANMSEKQAGGLPRTVRIGVEGISERLRTVCCKPISDDKLIDVLAKLRKARKNIKLFFIVGLPTESDEDYRQYLVTLKRMAGVLTSNLTQIMFHAFVPMSATPMGCMPIVDEYGGRVEKLIKDYLQSGFRSDNMMIFRPCGHETRRKRAMANLACSDKAIRQGFFYKDNRNWMVKTNANKAKLRKIAETLIK